MHTIAVPYLSSLYNGWTASLRARQEEQDRQRLSAQQAADDLRKVQEQLVIAAEQMVDAARLLKEQAAR